MHVHSKIVSIYHDNVFIINTYCPLCVLPNTCVTQTKNKHGIYYIVLPQLIGAYYFSFLLAHLDLYDEGSYSR